MSTNQNRKRGGLLAKKIGDTFEDVFLDCCTLNKIRAVRIPNAAKTIKSRGRFSLVRAKSPFDFLITKDGLSACLDTKTIDGDTFSYSKLCSHQVKWLNFTGPSIPSGYVIWFRNLDLVIFFNHEILSSLKPRESLKPELGLNLGSITNFNPERILDENCPEFRLTN